MTHASTKPNTVDYFRVPGPLWRKIKRVLPKPSVKRGPGRPPADPRAVLNGIWDVLWTGCQWKAVHRAWFGVASSVLHARFQTWQREGRFAKMMHILVQFYARTRRVHWQWQAIDSRLCAAPLGGEATGKNPTDRAKCGTKLHLLVDGRGAPLAVHVTGANRHDKCGVVAVVIAVVVRRPSSRQHLCADAPMTLPTCMSLCLVLATCRISSTGAVVASHLRRLVIFQVRQAFPPGAGWWSGRSIG
jgi:transposase